MQMIVLAIISFLIGSIPSGFLVGKMHGIDIRKAGSGNTGATNAKRVLGTKAGAVTLVIDIFKGVIPVSLAYFVIGESEAEIAPLLGVIAILGHCFSPFLKFHGGKGVATSLGFFFVLAPVATIIGLAVFLLLVKTTKFVSVGSLGLALTLLVMLLTGLPIKYENSTRYAVCAATILIIIRHGTNIKRLLNGQELSYNHRL